MYDELNPGFCQFEQIGVHYRQVQKSDRINSDRTGSPSLGRIDLDQV